MVRADKITLLMSNEIGFRGESLSLDNKKSNSGLYFQDISPLIDVEIIKNIQNDKTLSDEDIDDLLVTMRQQAVLQAVNKVFEGKHDFVLSVNLYPQEKSFKNTVPKYNKFVGFKITPVLKDHTIKIPWVELSFDGTCTFNLYLFNSNMPNTPIEYKEVTTVAGQSTIVALDWIIADDSAYKGGLFYLGYYDSVLGSVSAYKKDKASSNVGVYSPYFDIETMRMNGDISDTTIDVDTVDLISETFGLNIGVSIFNDYTDLVVNNKSMFWQAIQHQMHEIVLLKIKYSNRSNSTQRLAGASVEDVDFQLLGNPDLKIDGVQTKLANEINSIKGALFYKPRISKVTLR